MFTISLNSLALNPALGSSYSYGPLVPYLAKGEHNDHYEGQVQAT